MAPTSGAVLITYVQALVMGLVQGVTELFPISSLGQAVILPTILGWDSLARVQSRPESFFLAFLVGLHVATATALLIYFWSDWRGIIWGFFRNGFGRQALRGSKTGCNSK
jgi:undecaprenyl-diphosphatase